MVWLPGGMSHIDTYDPKPDASSEYRGPFKTISTKVPGTTFTELLPMNAKIADKFTIVRSMNQIAGGHPAGTMQMFSGDIAVGTAISGRPPAQIRTCGTTAYGSYLGC